MARSAIPMTPRTTPPRESGNVELYVRFIGGKLKLCVFFNGVEQIIGGEDYQTMVAQAAPQASAAPTLVKSGEKFVIAEDTQVLYAGEIVNAGEIVIGGVLVRVY